MTRTGTIKLIYREDEAAVRNYKSGTDRKNIIEYWKLMYAERFNKCAIQISPDIKDNYKYDIFKQFGVNKIRVV